MAGANAHQHVSDQVYEALLNKTKTELRVQRSNYYLNKLKGKKYLINENKERPEKPRARFLILSINDKQDPSVRIFTARSSTGFI